MSCPTIASGVLAHVSLVEQAVCGVTPPGVLAPTAVAITVGASTGILTRTGGSFITDGYLVEQQILITGSANDETNGYWRIVSVSALVVTVTDPLSELVAEPSGASIQIALEGLLASARNINLERDELTTSIVSPDRQVGSARHGLNRVTGSLGYELSLVAVDSLIRAAMSSEWTTPTIGSTGTLTLTNTSTTDHTAELTRGSGSWITDGIRPGDVLLASGSGSAENDRYWLVISVDNATDLTLADPTNSTPADTLGAIEYPGRRIDVGTTLRTFDVQRAFPDISAYQYFHTVAVGAMQLTANPDSPVSGSFEMIGASAEAIQASPLGGSAPSTVPTTDFFAAFDGYLYEAGEFNGVVTSIDFTLSNNRSLQGVVGSKYSPKVFDGQGLVEGTISVMFTGAGMYNRFFNEEQTNMTLFMAAPGAAGFVAFTIPGLKYMGATMDPPSEGPVIQEMSFKGLAVPVNLGAGLSARTSLTFQISNAVSDERVLP
jgi:hypothetical protein